LKERCNRYKPKPSSDVCIYADGAKCKIFPDRDCWEGKILK